jgi:DNA primase
MMGARDFYLEVVLPALADRLDQAFPEFGWRRDAHGWVATNEEHTHSCLGVRAERVVAHGPAPRGFLVHGGEPTLWTAYVNGGVVPRGADFVRAVKELAECAGVDPSLLERPEPPDRKAGLLHEVDTLCRGELVSERGWRARDYLESRGIPATSIEDSGLGLFPARDRVAAALGTAGYSESEIAASGMLADSRWPGRLVGAWRDERGRARTLWARSLSENADPDARYLYLRGARRSDLPPYGLSEVLSASPEARRDLVLVEGVFDVHQLRAHDADNVAALGGTGARPQLFERLTSLGVETVTLCLDNDDAGRSAAARTVEHAVRATRCPALFVVDPKRLDSAKDPDAYVLTRGIAAWRTLLEERQCAIAWFAGEHLCGVNADSSQEKRREVLSRVGAWLGMLPSRLALEQEDAVKAAAARCGYSPDAVERAFRARFWSEPTRVRLPAQERGSASQSAKREPIDAEPSF